MVDGSAYFGQIDEDEQKDGFGKEVSVLGNFHLGIFKEDVFIHGLVVTPAGYNFLYDSTYENNFVGSDPLDCSTKFF
jgi:hypothetical protein